MKNRLSRMSQLRRLLACGALLPLVMTASLACAGSEPSNTVTPGENPGWLNRVIQQLRNEPVANPPASVTRYEYSGKIVYYVPPQYADVWSTLYSEGGDVIAHPDGGLSGNGDGRARDFLEKRKNETVIWEDQRDYDPDMVKSPAPIDSIEIIIAESYPQQYFAAVTSGLPNSCAEYGGYYLDRNDKTIRIEVVNWKPADPNTPCAEIYRQAQTNIPLGSDFKSGETYTVEVNEKTASFVAQ